MSNRICFKSKENKDISKLKLPEFIGAGQEYISPKYEPERKCIFTYIKTDEFYGNRQHGLKPDRDWINAIECWAENNGLEITSDYELDSECKNKLII